MGYERGSEVALDVSHRRRRSLPVHCRRARSASVLSRVVAIAGFGDRATSASRRGTSPRTWLRPGSSRAVCSQLRALTDFSAQPPRSSAGVTAGTHCCARRNNLDTDLTYLNRHRTRPPASSSAESAAEFVIRSREPGGRRGPLLVGLMAIRGTAVRAARWVGPLARLGRQRRRGDSGCGLARCSRSSGTCPKAARPTRTRSVAAAVLHRRGLLVEGRARPLRGGRANGKLRTWERCPLPECVRGGRRRGHLPQRFRAASGGQVPTTIQDAPRSAPSSRSRPSILIGRFWIATPSSSLLWRNERCPGFLRCGSRAFG